MRILFVIESLKRGGKERQFTELINNLNLLSKKICLEIVLFRSDIDYQLQIDDKKIHVISGNLFRKSYLLLRIVQRFNPDIIHSWGILCTLISTSAIIRRKKIKLIDGSIGYAKKIAPFSKIDIISKINFYFADVVIANSDAGLQCHKKQANKKYMVIHNGIDSTRFTGLIPKNYVKESHGFIHKYYVGMIANFIISKDYVTMIEAANLILEKTKDVGFIFIGDGIQIDSIKNMVDPNLKEHFFFLGKIEDVESYIQVFNIGILLSNSENRKHAEGISNSILEMMATGIPVIATNTGGSIEIIENKKNGYLVEPFDKNGIVDIIEYLLINKNESALVGNRAKEMVNIKYSSKVMLSNYYQVYSELLSQI